MQIKHLSLALLTRCYNVMSKYCKYEYKETSRNNMLVLTISMEKDIISNMDQLFNTVIAMISFLDKCDNLSITDINTVNRFLSLAKHSNSLDIRNFLKRK